MPGVLVLVLNCGSSSVKFAILSPNSKETLLTGMVECIGLPKAKMIYKINGHQSVLSVKDINYPEALNKVFTLVKEKQEWFNNLCAVGHRVVHGGEFFKSSVLVTEDVIRKIEKCSNLAPLHNPANLLGIQKAKEMLANLPQIAVFDTAFHQTMPPEAYLYAIPSKYYRQYQARRYGFHGTSHHYVGQQACKILKKPFDHANLITAHLGNGCSITAIANGKSIDTSMGLTPLEGLVMGTRSGDLDPALHLYLADQLKINLAEVTNILNKKSGLLGLSELSMDLRTLEEEAEKGNNQVQVALDVMIYRLVKYIGAYAVILGCVDALVFTGGIGENSSFVRRNVIERLNSLNFILDERQNNTHGKHNHGIITQSDSIPAIVIKTNEELVIAKAALRLTQKEQNS
jgi:acetate kinase